jgi:predicted dehydrogenase
VTVVRVGIVGLGFGCLVHAPAFRADDRCQIVALASRDPARAVASALSLGGVRAFPNWQALVASSDVDVVTIAVPPAAQPAVVAGAAQAGKHVFCEKPLAATLAGAQDALAAVKTTGVTHAIDFTFPGIAAWQRARELLADGGVGRIEYFSYNWHVETRASRENTDTWKQRPEVGGGALANFGSHVLYNVEWLLGSIDALGAVTMSDKRRRGKAVTFSVRLENGAEGRVDIATDAFLGGGHRVEIHGDRGTLILANPGPDYVHGFSLLLGTRESGRLTTVVEPVLAAGDDGRVTVVANLARRFVDALGGAGSVAPNLVHGVRVQELLATVAEFPTALRPVPRSAPAS